ncbi:CPBP family glutamic-type intramembrane protease [Leptolyngbya sp. CCY15150]|uniref:CPBP family glutamic-type intramembrane protease n=1 Tax=Leptolyngbya sp. CCY15150 TaxID=2767772 RepID=UPI001951DF14|nr:CPBP family glutamic-type intramembrane protease [Leptolyngbya sp. CCY15150]
MKGTPTLTRHQSAPRRLITFLIWLAIAWLPFAALGYWVIPDANTRTIVVMVILGVEFVTLVRLWGWSVHGYPRPLQHYGLSGSVSNRLQLLAGLLVGLLSLMALYGLASLLGWVTWRSPSWSLLPIALEGLLVGVGVGVGEELVFRGWLLDELERDYRPAVALWSSSLIFAILHYLKPPTEILRTLPGFPGLVLLGLTLVWAKRSTATWRGLTRRGQLGLPIGLHAGLVWGSYVLHVGEWIDYGDRVPEWVTGIDQNPLAGLMGIGCLGLIAAVMGWRSRH